MPDRECHLIVEGKRSLIQSSPSRFTPVKKAAKNDENNDNVVEYRARANVQNPENRCLVKRNRPQSTIKLTM